LNAHHTAGWKKKPQVCGWVRLWVWSTTNEFNM
jgi:hypothetical protein